MRNLSEKDFSDLIYEKLESLSYEQVLPNQTIEDTSDECIELHTPLKSVNKTENAFPILSTFQHSITCWNKEQRKCMEMTNEVDAKLQEYNMVRTNTSPCIYDSVSQKYGITITFEVRYNAITDSFQLIR